MTNSETMTHALYAIWKATHDLGAGLWRVQSRRGVVSFRKLRVALEWVELAREFKS